MASRKRKQSEVDDDSRGRKKRLRVNGDVGSDDDEVMSDRDDDDAVVRRLSLSPLFNTSQTSHTQREAGIIEEVRVINFMSHSKLNFQCVV